MQPAVQKVTDSGWLQLLLSQFLFSHTQKLVAKGSQAIASVALQKDEIKDFNESFSTTCKKIIPHSLYYRLMGGQAALCSVTLSALMEIANKGFNKDTSYLESLKSNIDQHVITSYIAYSALGSWGLGALAVYKIAKKYLN